MDGILNINKAAGMTSFDVIAKLRKLLNTKKIGHAGTLDPDATGVLPVCIGKATKVIEFLVEKDKEYFVTLKLGVETDTQDASGTITKESLVASSDDEIRTAIESFIGDMMQIPPMYSAIRIKGIRLYEMARQGIEIEREARPVTIKYIKDIDIRRDGEDVKVFFSVACTKGTYMRTLCFDIGASLGCGGHMASLVRTRSGPFLLDDAITLEELALRKQSGTLEEIILNMDKALPGLPAFSIDDDQTKRLRNGLTIQWTDTSESKLVRLYSRESVFLSIGEMMNVSGEIRLKSYKWLGV